jgi:hypothetical protein
MPISYFTLGFMAALISVAIVLTIIYSRLKRIRNRQTDIKGYLDLIPDLTKQQRDRVREIRRVFLPKVEGIRRDLCLKRAELADLLFAEPSDRSKINSVAEQIIRHQSELENEVVEHILEEKEILSSAQKRKFYEIIVEQFSSGGLGVHDVKGRKT